MNDSLLDFDGYLFDLDGTIYRGPALVPRAGEVVATLRRRGRAVAFVSNKPIQTRENYAAKLTRLGIPTGPDEVVNSSLVMARWLSAQAPGARVFALGEPPLLADLRRAGLTTTEDLDEIEWVVASFDRTLDYRKLNLALQALKRGARFVATNPDRTCPVEGGEVFDSAGTIAALEATSGRKCEVIVGKPSAIMARTGLQMLGVRPERALFVGDRLETDVARGRAAGMKTALVLTGVTSRNDLAASDLKPDYVLDSVADCISRKRGQSLFSRGQA
ncbi:MAG: HAD-IIA family hydrolase [Armatimonadota bacterium]